ncbi:MAG TPA: glycosyltransferase family 39 protein [Vicinamibacterales bacterium]|jgi:4-amino-4-deoxy-L-arabinose transferase-like glycosyltransferase|nr:glycosyltransferase family 39 protein [Vicinamibacterales bacterium]
MSDKEWREAIDMRSSLVSVGIVVLSAALLRFWSLGQGPVSPVESRTIDGVIQLTHTGSYHPAALTNPALPIYLHTIVAVIHFLLGAAVGAWSSLGSFGPEDIVLWGRGVSALFGVATVLVVYRIGIRWGARHGLLAAGLMAVTPAHVAASREIAEGAPLTLLTALTLLLSIEAVERGKGRFVAAGIASGLGAATHYAAALLLMMPLTAVWMSPDHERPRSWRGAFVVLAAIGAFVIGNPLSVRDLPVFLDGFAQAASPLGKDILSAPEIAGRLGAALEWPGVILALAGVILGIVRAIAGPGHTRWTLLVSFPVVFFAIVAWHGAASDVILLPVIPASALLAGIAVVSGVSLLRRFEIPRTARTALIAALTVFVLLPPAVVSIEIVVDAHGRHTHVAVNQRLP